MTKFPQQLLAATALAVAVSSVVQASVWIGGGADNEFSTTGNWDDGGITGTQDINGAFTVERSVDSIAERTFVAGGATLNVTGGTHSDSRPGNTIRNFVGFGSEGTVNQSGGSYNIGHLLLVGGSNASGDGTFNLTDGSLLVSRGGNSFMGIAGGSSMEIGTGGGAGLFKMSGGTLETRIGVGVGATGVFEVVGNAAGSSIGIGSNGTLDGFWNQEAGGTLSVAVDDDGLTPIFIDEVDGDDLTGGNGNVTFQNGSLLDVGFVGSEVLGSFTVMTWEGTVDDRGLAFAPGVDTDLWSFSVNDNSLTIQAGDGIPGDFDMDNDVDGADFLRWQQDGLSGEALTIWQNSYGPSSVVGSFTAIPEPTSVMLLALGGLVMLGGRRKV